MHGLKVKLVHSPRQMLRKPQFILDERLVGQQSAAEFRAFAESWPWKFASTARLRWYSVMFVRLRDLLLWVFGSLQGLSRGFVKRNGYVGV
jgi:hypothetical protein